MKTLLKPRSLTAVAGVAAIIGLGGLTAACGNEKTEGPSTTTTTTTTTTVTPTEKGLNPGGGNLFTPTHVVTPAPPTGGGKGGH